MFWGILECLFWSDSESYCSGTVEFLSWNRGSTTCAMRCSPWGVFLWAVPPAQVNWWGRGCSSTAWPLAGSWGLEQAPTGHTIGMKSQYGWGLKVPLEIRWSSPPAQHRLSSSRLPSAVSFALLKISSHRNPTHALWTTCTAVWAPSEQKKCWGVFYVQV